MVDDDSDVHLFDSSPLVVLRGSSGSVPVPARLPGLAVGRSSHGLQAAVDADPLRHLQLLAGELATMFLFYCSDTGPGELINGHLLNTVVIPAVVLTGN